MGFAVGVQLDSEGVVVGATQLDSTRTGVPVSAGAPLPARAVDETASSRQSVESVVAVCAKRFGPAEVTICVELGYPSVVSTLDRRVAACDENFIVGIWVIVTWIR